MLINDTFSFLKKNCLLFFIYSKSGCTKKELLYLHTRKFLLVCLTRFKMENKQKHQNNNHTLYYFENIVDTHLKPCLIGIVVHFQRLINALFYLAYFLVSFSYFCKVFRMVTVKWPLSIIVHCQHTEFPNHSRTIAQLYYFYFGCFWIFQSMVER